MQQELLDWVCVYVQTSMLAGWLEVGTRKEGGNRSSYMYLTTYGHVKISTS